jgi:hypothetical protein
MSTTFGRAIDCDFVLLALDSRTSQFFTQYCVLLDCCCCDDGWLHMDR